MNPNQINYAAMMTEAKVAARDIARLRETANAQSKLRCDEASVKHVNQLRDEVLKRIAIVEFNISIVNPKDPQKDDKLKNYEESLASHQVQVTALDKDLESANKAVAETQAVIQDIQDGKVKCSYENMVDRAKFLIEERIGKAFNEGDYNGVSA